MCLAYILMPVLFYSILCVPALDFHIVCWCSAVNAELQLQLSFFSCFWKPESRLEQEIAVVCFLSRRSDVTPLNSAKLQLDAGWTLHMSGKGGVVL